MAKEVVEVKSIGIGDIEDFNNAATVKDYVSISRRIKEMKSEIDRLEAIKKSSNGAITTILESLGVGKICGDDYAVSFGSNTQVPSFKAVVEKAGEAIPVETKKLLDGFYAELTRTSRIVSFNEVKPPKNQEQL